MSISAETRNLLLDGRIYDCRPGETVLEALLRQNVAVPNACRHQVCLTCMMLSLGGAPPSASQTNLKDNLRTQHFFLACGCHPERDMDIALHLGDGCDQGAGSGHRDQQAELLRL